MISFSGACLATKSSIFSLMSKMITIPIIRRIAMKKVSINFFVIYTSSFLGNIVN